MNIIIYRIIITLLIELVKENKLIQVSKNNYEKLILLGKYGDTLDSIISRVLEQNTTKLGNQEFPN